MEVSCPLFTPVGVADLDSPRAQATPSPLARAGAGVRGGAQPCSCTNLSPASRAAPGSMDESGRTLNLVLTVGIIYFVFSHIREREARAVNEERRLQKAEQQKLEAKHEARHKEHDAERQRLRAEHDAALSEATRLRKSVDAHRRLGAGQRAPQVVDQPRRSFTLGSVPPLPTADLPPSKGASSFANDPAVGAPHEPTRGDIFLRLSQLLLKDDLVSEAGAREFVRESHRALSVAHGLLDNKLLVGPPTSRAGYLSSLRELIGKPPPAPHTWKDEWLPMTKEWLLRLKRKEDNWAAAERLPRESLEVLHQKKGFQDEMDELRLKMGWETKHAEAWVLLGLRRDVIALALKEGRRDCALYASRK